MQTLITNPTIQPWNKLRLVVLYALRYQKSQANNVASLISLMLENGVNREDAKVCCLNVSLQLPQCSTDLGLW